MPRVLITGMSATGKSTVLRALAARGHRVQDLDAPGWSYHDPDGHQFWEHTRVRALLDAAHADRVPLFLAGCSESQIAFYPDLTHVILLTAPRDRILQRLADRTDNPYGKTPAQRAEILHNLDTIEPLLRRRASLILDTDAPPDATLRAVLTHTGLANAP